MKHSLTVAIFLTLAALALLATRRESGLPLINRAQASGEKPAAAPAITDKAQAPAGAQADGNVLLVQAATKLKQLPTLEAKMRMQTKMLGQELSGTGSYHQLLRGPDTHFKLEMKLQVGNQVSSLLQVSDGRFLWTRRDLPTHKLLGRIDQRAVYDALARANRTPAPVMGTNAMALGGLPRLLETVASNFKFEAPRDASTLGAPAWMLQGTWHPNALAALWPERAAALKAGQAINLSELPEQLPTHVVVLLSRDPALPLFPQRVEYQRVDAAGQRVSLVTLELFDVRKNVALDPRLFAYKPGDQVVEDHTEVFLRSLGL
jgi:hypothetical protein